MESCPKTSLTSHMTPSAPGIQPPPCPFRAPNAPPHRLPFRIPALFAHVSFPSCATHFKSALHIASSLILGRASRCHRPPHPRSPPRRLGHQRLPLCPPRQARIPQPGHIRPDPSARPPGKPRLVSPSPHRSSFPRFFFLSFSLRRQASRSCSCEFIRSAPWPNDALSHPLDAAIFRSASPNRWISAMVL